MSGRGFAGVPNATSFSLGTTVSGATTVNRANGRFQYGTLTGNLTLTLTAGTVIGDELVLAFTQDGTGSRTMTWPGNAKLAGGALVLTTTAGKTDTVGFVWDGTNWRERSRSLSQ